MSLEENKAIIRKWFEAENKKDLALLDEFVAIDFVDHTHQLKGLKEYKQFVAVISKGFSDFNETIKDIIAEGDKVSVFFEFTGTNTSEWMGLDPTGKKVTIMIVEIFRIANGKVAEEWEVADELGFHKELGLIEYTEKAKKLFPKDVS
jgi:predicted ester cyclase